MLHLVEENVLFVISVVLFALLFLRDLRRERLSERLVLNVRRSSFKPIIIIEQVE
jgi:hypothetical protein